MFLKPARAFPAWHFSMLNDDDRNKKIESSLESMPIEGKTVFEIGTGAGLTAMLFARLGAKRILTCETNPQLFTMAKQIFERNSLAERIEIVNKASSQVISDGDLDLVPDVIFTETIDCGIVGEGFNSIKDDISQIVQPGTVVVPENFRQFGYLVESDELYKLNSVGSHCEFDLSELNIYSTQAYFPVRAGLYRSRILTPVFKMRELSYVTPHDSRFSLVSTAQLDGMCHGIISFFEADFGRYVVTNDLRSMGHWHQAFHPFDKPMQICAARDYRLTFDFFGSANIEEN